MRHKYVMTGEGARIIGGQRIKKGEIFFLDKKCTSNNFKIIEDDKPKKKIVKEEKPKEVKNGSIKK